MGIKSTHQVLRQDALNIIYSRLNDITDDQLSNVLEEVIHNGYYNFEIVDTITSPHMFITEDNVPEYNDTW